MRLFFFLYFLIPISLLSQDLCSDSKIEIKLNEANSMFWLSRARQNSLPEANRAQAFLDTALTLVKGSNLPSKCKRSYLHKISIFQDELADLIAVTMDNLNGNYPMLPFLTKQYDQLEYFDESIETALEKSLENLLQSGIYKPSKELKDVLLFSVVQCPGHEEMVEVAAQFLNNNSRMYVISQHEIYQALGPKGLKTDSALFKLGQFFSTDYIGKVIVSKYEHSKNVSYYGARFEFYDLINNEIVSNTYAEGMKVNMQGKSSRFYKEFGLFLLITMLLAIGLYYYTQKSYRRTKNVATAISVTIISLLLTIGATIGLFTAFSTFAPSGGEFLGEPKVAYFPFLVSITFTILPLLLLILSALILKRFVINEPGNIHLFLFVSQIALLFPFAKTSTVYLNESISLWILIPFITVAVILSFIAASVFWEFTKGNKSIWYKLLIIPIYVPLYFSISEILKLGNQVDLALIITMIFLSIGIVFIVFGLYKFFDRSTAGTSFVEQSENEQNFGTLINSMLTSTSTLSALPFRTNFEETLSLKITEFKGFRHLHLHGSPGIGKTSLINHVLDVQKESFLSYYGDCDENQEGATIPYEPFFQAFSAELGTGLFYNGTLEAKELLSKAQPLLQIAGVGDVVDKVVSNDNSFNGASVVELSKSIVQLLVQKTKEVQCNRVVIVIEDIHWIDTNSKDLLFKLKNELLILSKRSQNPINVCLLTTSSIETEVSTSLIDQFQQDFASDNTNEFELWGNENQTLTNSLDQLASDHFVSNLLSYEYSKCHFTRQAVLDIEAFVQRAEVIKPRYVLELLKYLLEKDLLISQNGVFELKTDLDWDQIPFESDLEKIYFEKFKSLPSEVRKVLESAAFVGMEFEADLLSQLWKIDRIVLIHNLILAERIGIVVDVSEHDDVYRFGSKSIRAALKRFSIAESPNTKKIPQIVKEYHKEIIQITLKRFNDESLFLDQLPHELSVGLAQRAMLVYTDQPLRALTICMSTANKLLSAGQFSEIPDILKFISKIPNSKLKHHKEYWHLFLKLHLSQLNSNPIAYERDFGLSIFEMLNDIVRTDDFKNNSNPELELEVYFEIIYKLKLEEYYNSDLFSYFKAMPLTRFYDILISRLQQSTYFDEQIQELKNIFLEINEDSTQRPLKGKILGILAMVVTNQDDKYSYLVERIHMLFPSITRNSDFPTLFKVLKQQWRALDHDQINDLGFILSGLYQYMVASKQDKELLFQLSSLRLTVNEHLNHRIGIFISSLHVMEYQDSWSADEFIDFAERLFYSYPEGSFRAQIFPLVVAYLIHSEISLERIATITLIMKNSLNQSDFISEQELNRIFLPRETYQTLLKQLNINSEEHQIVQKLLKFCK